MGKREGDLFSNEGPGFTLSEISKRIGVNKTSVYRFVNTYCSLGYLRRDERSKMYKLGVCAMALAHSFLQRAEMVQPVKLLVDDVHKQYDLHVDVGIFQDDAIYVIYRRESNDTLAFRHFTTESGLYYLATGKAAMAFLADAELESLLARLVLSPKTENTIVDKDCLREELKATRGRGYALTREEFVPGLIAIGAPIINLHTRKVLGGVSFDAPPPSIQWRTSKKIRTTPG